MVGAREYHERTKLSLTEPMPESLTPDPDPAAKPRLWKEYADRPRTSLPGVRPTQVPALSAVAQASPDPRAGRPDGAPGPTVDREAVATLCYEAGGVTQVVDRDGERVRFRAASCTGRKYHVELYLVAGGLPDLPAGVFHFDPDGFALDDVRDGDHRGTLARAVGDRDAGVGSESSGTARTGVADAPVTAVLTSDWWRNAYRYGDRTYRHVLWDAGTVTANLLATAHACGYRASVVGSFADETVADVVGVDTDEELPVALVPLGRGGPAPAARDPGGATPETVPAGPVTREHSLVRAAWRQSTLPDGAAAAAWRRRCVEAGPVGGVAADDDAGTEASERVALDPVDPTTASARPLHETVRRRGSCREYATRGPTRRQVATILDRATRGVPGEWRLGADADVQRPGLSYGDCHLLTTGVEGLRDGHYRYRPAAEELVRLGETSRADTGRLALGQRHADEAHVNCYMITDLDALVGRLGDRAYRLAQLEAGVVLGRLYLATWAHRDLGGCGLTFADDAVTGHLDPDGGRTPTCLFAFGRRAE